MGKFWLDDDVVDHYLDKMNGNEFKVLVAITRHYNKKGTCFPSIRRLSLLLNMHTSTIGKCLKRLNLLGFLEQLAIRERCKLHYKFSKSARYLLIDSQNLPEKFSSKEVIKEDIKEGVSQPSHEQKMALLAEELKNTSLVAYKQICKNKFKT